MLVDTLKAQERLTQEFGFDEHRARGIVELFSSAENRVATSDDLEALETRMDARMEALEARLSRKLYAVAFVTITVLGALNFFT